MGAAMAKLQAERDAARNDAAEQRERREAAELRASFGAPAPRQAVRGAAARPAVALSWQQQQQQQQQQPAAIRRVSLPRFIRGPGSLRGWKGGKAPRQWVEAALLPLTSTTFKPQPTPICSRMLQCSPAASTSRRRRTSSRTQRRRCHRSTSARAAHGAPGRRIRTRRPPRAVRRRAATCRCRRQGRARAAAGGGGKGRADL